MPEVITKEIIELGDKIVDGLKAVNKTLIAYELDKNGLAPVETSDVNFYDYDGTVLYAYTADDFLAMTGMPKNPVHEGLTSQGWNWSFEDARNYVSKYGMLEIGQMYITDDGKTRIYLDVNIRLTVPLCIQQTVSNGVVIDWGDGSEPETIEGTGVVKTSHTYPKEGEYLLTLDPEDSCELGFGDGVDRNIFNEIGISPLFSRDYSLCIKEIYIGKCINSIGPFSFYACTMLQYLTMPKQITDIGESAFVSAISLVCVIVPAFTQNLGASVFSGLNNVICASLPNGIQSISMSAFINSYRLKHITIPEGPTKIGRSAYGKASSASSITISDSIETIELQAFAGIQKIYKITIPASVKNIGSQVFTQCYGLSLVTMLPTTPPTASGADVFLRIATDCVIYVPYSEDHSILNAYKTATNWSTYADMMVESEPVEAVGQ